MPGEMVAKRCIVTASRLRSVASENASTDRHGDLPVEEDTLVITQRYILCGVCIFPSSANSSWWRNGSEDRQSGRMETQWTTTCDHQPTCLYTDGGRTAVKEL